MRASVAYDTSLLFADADAVRCHKYLEKLAERVGDRGDICADVPEEAFDGSDDLDITMYGTTPLMSFSELFRDVPIDAIVTVQYKYSSTPKQKVSHIVVVGQDGFQLCTCLKRMRCGLHCSHVLAALATRLDRASDFIGESTHPRWRSFLEEWSLRNAKLGHFERGAFTGRYTDDFGGADIDPDIGRDGGQDTLSKDLKNTRGKMYADFVAKSSKWASAAAAKVDGSPGSLQALNL